MRAVVLALVLVGCGGAQATTGAESSSSSSPESTESAVAGSPPREGPPASATSATRTEPSVTADPGPPPVLAVRGIPDRHRQVAIAIENRGATTASIARAIGIEVAAGETWSALEGVTLSARADCEHEAPSCQELAPGAALEPPDWLGTIGDAQCACERCAAAPPGTYRLVVRTCDGAHVVPGAPFDL